MRGVWVSDTPCVVCEGPEGARDPHCLHSFTSCPFPRLLPAPGLYACLECYYGRGDSRILTNVTTRVHSTHTHTYTLSTTHFLHSSAQNACLSGCPSWPCYLLSEPRASQTRKE